MDDGTSTFSLNNLPTGRYIVKIEATHPSGYVSNATLVVSGTIQYIPLNRRTIIANNGFVSTFDGNSYFCVQNTAVGQKIIMKGLPTTADSLELSDGQLYSDNSGFVRVY